MAIFQGRCPIKTWGGLLTSHQVHVRQCWRWCQGSGWWEQGRSSWGRCVGHLQDQRGLEEMSW